jgi:hypothetical protein
MYFRIPPGQDMGRDGRMMYVEEAEDEDGVGEKQLGVVEVAVQHLEDER